jgi:hypothetical protein
MLVESASVGRLRTRHQKFTGIGTSRGLAQRQLYGAHFGSLTRWRRRSKHRVRAAEHPRLTCPLEHSVKGQVVEREP